MALDTTVICYGKTYNDEMAQFIDRRTAPRIWTFREFGQSWVAYVRKSDDSIVVLQDDARLDFTRVIVFATREAFEAHKKWRTSENNIYVDR